VHLIRMLPTLGGQWLQAVCTLAFTVAGLIWLNPASAPLAVLAGGVAIAIPLLAQNQLGERDLRVQTYVGALSRFIFDALLGLLVVRAHNAERAMRREQERLLVEWVRSSRGFFRTVVFFEGVQVCAGFGFAITLLLLYVQTVPQLGGALLLVYWALSLPQVGQEIALLARQYPRYRTTMLRLLEPLGALEEPGTADGTRTMDAPSVGGVAVQCAHISVQAMGQTILDDVSFDLQAGEHIAVVGPSGAGKSSLVGLLLGWHRPVNGQVLIDGHPLDGRSLDELRQVTAWVDPAVQLWNRSLFDNLHYGLSDNIPATFAAVLTSADVRLMLEGLPDGLQTHLGEGGSLLSGGEGQRVRLARAMLRSKVRLVVLDEPFRGLSHDRRRHLLQEVRKHWHHATLICISHDITDTELFERVLVIEDGRVVEDGAPAALVAQPASRYRTLRDRETTVHTHLWRHPVWQRLRVERGNIDREPATYRGEGIETNGTAEHSNMVSERDRAGA
ncbi:MAG: ABC transporter ATP-binding protein, partial [Chloroflexaceae bacterium]|nr:ABC transporter ATP-binding protein [Chloroflexaceae bacterium]